MKQCRQFKHLLNAVKKYTDDIKLVTNTFATGKIIGYKFRLFQEFNTNYENGTNDKYQAFLLIKDENAEGTMWPAFYNEEEIDEWVNKF